MEMKWPPNILDGLFCDKKDHKGLYYWYGVVMEKIKVSNLEPGEKIQISYDMVKYHHGK